jgi:hypothetical protein
MGIYLSIYFLFPKIEKNRQNPLKFLIGSLAHSTKPMPANKPYPIKILPPHISYAPPACYHRIAVPLALTLFKPGLNYNSIRPLFVRPFHILIALFVVELFSSQ